MKKQKIEKLKEANLHSLFKEFLIERKLLKKSDQIDLHEISFIKSNPMADGQVCVEWEQIPETIQTPNGPVVVFRKGACIRWAQF